MNTNEIHRFDLGSLRHEETRDSGGVWPKVMALGGDRLVVANWYSETVDFLPLSPRDPTSPRRLLPVDPVAENSRRSIPLTGEPRGMVVVGSPPEVWICEFSTGDITILDLASGEVIDRLDLGPGAARHIVAAEGGRRLYYSDMYHGTVSVIDRVSRHVTNRRRLGINLNTIVLDPRGRYLYVSERGRNNPESYLLPGPEFGRIFVLDAESLEVVQTVWGRQQPTGLAVSADGRYLATTDFLDDNLAVYRVAD
jgi:DNA-binding beta-propeller fold protein YncE